MELNEHYLLEEVLGLRRSEMNWELAIATEMNEWNFDCSDSLPMYQQHNDLNYLLNGQDQYLATEVAMAAGSTGDSMSYNTLETPPPPTPRPSSFEVYNIRSMEEEELGILEDEIHNLEVQANDYYCKVEPIVVESPEKILPIFNTGGTCDDFSQQKIVNYSCSKKLQGQPSKNLMAERRRRKRLNDRLSMLRSIVPKISKMDRTAILADAIEYVKELMEKIKILEKEINNPNKLGILRSDVKPNNEYLVRNSAKFNVERREDETKIEICCAAKPGLLLSTVNTLEAMGLDIQHCVISCFNDFAIQASCSQGNGQGTMVSTEEVKQALFENAGYGGKCL